MAEETKKAATKEDPRIHGDRFSLAEHTNFVHHARVENQIKREHLLNPEFWSHVSAKISQGDTIKVRNDEFSFYGELLVIDAGSGYAKVHVLAWHELTGKEAAKHQSKVESDDYEVQFKGNTRLHVVLRKSDGAVLKEGLRTKIDAQAWLDVFIKGGAQEEPQMKAA